MFFFPTFIRLFELLLLLVGFLSDYKHQKCGFQDWTVEWCRKLSCSKLVFCFDLFLANTRSLIAQISAYGLTRWAPAHLKRAEFSICLKISLNFISSSFSLQRDNRSQLLSNTKEVEQRQKTTEASFFSYQDTIHIEEYLLFFSVCNIYAGEALESLLLNTI